MVCDDESGQVGIRPGNGGGERERDRSLTEPGCPAKKSRGSDEPLRAFARFWRVVSYLGGGTYLGRAPRGLLLCKLHAPLQRGGRGSFPPVIAYTQ